MYSEYRDKLFSKVLDVIEDGMSITFTPDNVAEGDHFLIFSAWDSCTVTFHNTWVEFSNDEPMHLDECPTSFFESILKNIDKAIV